MLTYGNTENCRRCEALQAGDFKNPVAHSEACRARIEAHMRQATGPQMMNWEKRNLNFTEPDPAVAPPTFNEHMRKMEMSEPAVAAEEPTPCASPIGSATVC